MTTTRMTSQKLRLSGDLILLVILAPIALGCAFVAGVVKGARVVAHEVAVEASVWKATWRITKNYRGDRGK